MKPNTTSSDRNLSQVIFDDISFYTCGLEKLNKQLEIKLNA